ncbi:MAG TPA: FAD-dependent oxidoreductase [Acidimicrobiales bacterium]
MVRTRRCVVIGAGLLGLSAAWSLSRRGWSVHVLEAAGAVGHPLSGSKGDARIFRLGYREPRYVEMAVAARARWRELEDIAERTLLHETGQLSFGHADEIDAVANALTRQGQPNERLTTEEAATRCPGVSIDGPGPALFEPASGVLVADACLEAFRVTGAFDVEPRCTVTEVLSSPEGAVVRCADGRIFDAEVAVDCAGPRALALLSDARPQAIVAPPSLPQVAYFRPAALGGTDATRLPVFIEWSDAMVYGLPVLGSGVHAGTFKVSHHTPGPSFDGYDPAAQPPLGGELDDPALLAVLIDAVRRLLPGLDPTPVATERCVYDNSVDADFVLDRIGNVVVGCGTSGHGFKFGPLFGELLADLADGTTPPIDLRPFRLDRAPSTDQRDTASR